MRGLTSIFMSAFASRNKQLLENLDPVFGIIEIEIDIKLQIMALGLLAIYKASIKI